MSAVRSFVDRHRLEAYGAVGVAAVALVIVLIVALYLQAFTRFVTVQVRTDRAGLLLDVGSDVSLRSVAVGKVAAIRLDGPDSVVVTAELDPEQAEYVPADVRAQIVAPTLFGPKYVDLVAPDGPVAAPIGHGAVIEAATVQVEANRVFDTVMGLLTEVRPARINSALGAISTALQGRGDETGAYLQELNGYLRQLNPELPALRADLATAPDVVEAYADAAPDFVALLENATTTADTLTQRRAAFDAFLASLTAFGGSTRDVLDDIDEPLVSALDVLRPTAETLERYSPIFPCFFANLNYERIMQEPSFGGVVPGLRTHTTFQPGVGPYEYPANLPSVGAVDDPTCHDRPERGGPPPGHVTFDDRSPDMQVADRPYTYRVPSPAALLFGEAGPGLVGTVTGGGR